MTIAIIFHWVDYALFGLTLAVSLLIGVYYAIQMKRRKFRSSADEMLVGGRTMGIIPVALSLFVTFMSPIGIMGVAAEVYTFGGMYLLQIIGRFIVTPVTFNIILPIYHQLKLTSAYEYIDLRFNKIVGLMFSVAFISQMLSYIAMVLYAPSLALSQVTGVSLWTTIVVGGIVCTVYTAIGGVRAVIWSDVFQAVIMLVGLVVICIIGTIRSGGLFRVFEISEQGGRMPYFEFDTDPLRRTSFWSLNIGAMFMGFSVESSSQAILQRCFSVGNIRDAKISAWMNKILYILYLCLQCFSGLVAYAYYHTCDPLLEGRISRRDQLFPLLVMDLFHHLPGLPGLFLSVILSAALSTISSGLNSLAAVILKDFAQPLYSHYKKEEMPGSLALYITVLTAVILGVVNVGLALTLLNASQLVIQMCSSLWSIAGGAMAGVVILAVFFPCSNSWGAGSGFVVGSLVVAWLSIGGMFSDLSSPYLELSDSGCNATQYNTSHWATWENPQNITVLTLENTANNSSQSTIDARTIYDLSYHYYTPVGTILTVIIGLVVSALTGGNAPGYVDPKLYYSFEWPSCFTRGKTKQGYKEAGSADEVQLSEHEHVKESAPLHENDDLRL